MHRPVPPLASLVAGLLASCASKTAARPAVPTCSPGSAQRPLCAGCIQGGRQEGRGPSGRGGHGRRLLLQPGGGHPQRRPGAAGEGEQGGWGARPRAGDAAFRAAEQAEAAAQRHGQSCSKPSCTGPDEGGRKLQQRLLRAAGLAVRGVKAALPPCWCRHQQGRPTSCVDCAATPLPLATAQLLATNAVLAIESANHQALGRRLFRSPPAASCSSAPCAHAAGDGGRQRARG